MLKKGQSILEYMIILAVIVGAVVVGTLYMRNSTQQGLKDATEAMKSSTEKFKDQIGGGTGSKK